MGTYDSQYRMKVIDIRARLAFVCRNAKVKILMLYNTYDIEGVANAGST